MNLITTGQTTIFALLLACVAAGPASACEGGGPDRAAKEGKPSLLRHADALGLTEAQKESIAKLEASTRERAEPLRDQLRALRADGSVLRNDPRAQALLEQLRALGKAHREALSGILTESQMEQLQALRAEREGPSAQRGFGPRHRRRNSL